MISDNDASFMLVLDGVCHIYVDKYADVQKAEKIVVDAKVDYPAACNAMVSNYRFYIMMKHLMCNPVTM
mgnify:CR=1 FL=1